MSLPTNDNQSAQGIPSTQDSPPGDTKPSQVEGFKNESHHLRGAIGSELTDGNEFFGAASVQLLKHHGTYQQDDRDSRSGSKEGGKSAKAYMFMVRTKIPGGKLTSPQLLAELDLCDEVANSTLRITSRQGLQLHGVVKDDLQRTIRHIHDVQLSTLGACGDVQRNVMCCPAPHENDPVRRELQSLADRLAEHLAPKTRAYHEIWLRDLDSGEEQQVASGAHGNDAHGEDVEPIYGRTYLPRKFKTAIGLPEDNCVDLYTHDLGFMGIVRTSQLVGYNVLVGGGQGVTPSAKKTYPALGMKLAFIKPEQAVDVATAIVKVQRDFGNRSDRKIARLKYTVRNLGLETFKHKVEEYYGSKLPDPEPDDVHGFDDHMGWHEQGDGHWYYGLNVENGRIKDDEKMHLKSAIREICRTFAPGVRLTSHQSILFTDLRPSDRTAVEDIFRRHRVPLTEQVSTVRRWSMACVAWPTCGLSITESERALPGILDQMEVALARFGLSSESFTVRMTGCPNGCARPYNCDIGLVGKAKGKYTVLVGGRLLGNRLNFIFKDLIPEEEVVAALVPLFAYFKQDRLTGESFGDFCDRKGNAELLAWSERYEVPLTATGA